MSLPRYRVARGFLKQMLIWYPAGSDLTGWSAEMTLRKLSEGSEELSASSTVTVNAACDAFAGDETHGPGFIGEISAVNSAALTPGANYLADFKVTDASGTEKPSKPWIFEVYQPASEPA